MRSMLKVTHPSDTQDLTTVATVKAELGISGSSEDDQVQTWIAQASAAISTYCDRVFAEEGVIETFYLLHDPVRHVGFYHHRVLPLWLSRYPVTEIQSLTQDGSSLTEDEDFELDDVVGELWRLANGHRVNWHGTVTIEYTGGYPLLDGLPYDVERACLMLVSEYRSGAGTVAGLTGLQDGDQRIWFASQQQTGALAPPVLALLKQYRRVVAV